ncbi:IS30 family transposase [Lactobacillus sp. ESL0228]|uniref:IS30 family transposase n=1 Tax=Lactobacillus sp. ESL0228 TaxID=2069352 RepID=UPI000EFD47C0|nr:IS30 family transposase [Lactobacillus sp. ESL0228]RMC46921.1 IS30 family transposase [Lactobacillus sp. ESL0228]
MNSLNSTISNHQKGQHLALQDRVIIQVLRQQGQSLRQIAASLNCSPATVKYELERGQIALYHGQRHRYDAQAAQRRYQARRLNCGRKQACLAKTRFIKYVEAHFFKHGWSLDACVSRALASGKFTRAETVCTKTLYHYVERGLLQIKATNLPECLSRKTKAKRIRQHKRRLGRSISERPAAINQRREFGHWECDLVLGHKTKDDQALLTLYERMTRKFMIIPIKDKTAASVMTAFKILRSHYQEHWNEVFKTITTDNGSEFADLAQLERVSQTLVYYAHPYTSCEKGGVERHNRLIRRFIPKGKYIKDYDMIQIYGIEEWCNNLPRKILAYHTPDELYEKRLDCIYQIK